MLHSDHDQLPSCSSREVCKKILDVQVKVLEIHHQPIACNSF